MNITLVNFKELSYELQLETRNWRNSDNVRKYFQIQNISLDEHQSWLKTLHKDNPKTIAFLIEYDNKPIGVTYFHSIDNVAKETDWGIYIYDSSIRGKGLGREVLKQSIDYAEKNMQMRKIKLEVKKDNLYAIKLYESFGFQFVQNKDINFLQFSKDISQEF